MQHGIIVSGRGRLNVGAFCSTLTNLQHQCLALHVDVCDRTRTGRV